MAKTKTNINKINALKYLALATVSTYGEDCFDRKGGFTKKIHREVATVWGAACRVVHRSVLALIEPKAKPNDRSLHSVYAGPLVRAEFIKWNDVDDPRYSIILTLDQWATVSPKEIAALGRVDSVTFDAAKDLVRIRVRAKSSRNGRALAKRFGVPARIAGEQKK